MTKLTLIANGHKATIYEINRKSGAKLVKEIQTEMTRIPGHLLENERPGRVFDSAGQGRHSVETADLQEQNKISFAKDTAELINYSAKDTNYNIVIIASPELLGQLRLHLDKKIQDRIIAQISKDLTHVAQDKLVDTLIAENIAL